MKIPLQKPLPSTILETEPTQVVSHNLDLLSRKFVARLLSVHVATIKRYERAGKLPAVRFNSRSVRYKRTDVESLIAKSSVSA